MRPVNEGMPASSRLPVLALLLCTLAACSSSGSDDESSPPADAPVGDEDDDANANVAPGADTATYEAPVGQPCATPGTYDWKIDLVLPDGDVNHCFFGKVNQALFEGTGVPLTDDGLEKKECTVAETTAPATCSFEGTRCNWSKTSVSLQDGENGTKIGKVTIVTGAKAFSATRVSFFGSEHHVLNDGTEMFPKCSWVVTGTEK